MNGGLNHPPTIRANAKVRAIVGWALSAVCLFNGALAQDTKPRPFAVLELRPPSPYVIPMVLIPAGSFVMGADKNSDEKPHHPVTLRSFLIGKTEVTQGQWKAVMGNNPSRFSQCGDDCPVEQVSWDDAQDFIRKLNQKTGLAYRLPSEAEWEYAARAGSTTEWSHGNDESQLADFAWFSTNSGSTKAVGQKRPNSFGLYDMHGNVWEWVEDCWHDNYIGAPADGSTWTTACRGNTRVLRGGSWGINPSILRSAIRDRYSPDYRVNFIGLRLARTP